MGCTNSLKKFKARTGSPFKEEDAQVIGETIDEICKRNGGKFKSEDIVKEAKSKKNPLHEYFEWDDNVCGEKYRLQQARNITNHIVEILIVDDNPIEQRSFHHVMSVEQEPVYVTLKDAIEEVDYRKQLLDKMIVTLENLTVTMKLFKSQDTK